MIVRFAALLLALMAAPLSAAPAWPDTEQGRPAITGIDPVSYFSGTPVKGSAEFAAAQDGVTFHFATAANRDAFAANPARFTPQFGGYCAWAASQGRLSVPDPMIWKIVDDRLYLNCSKDAEAKWLADVPGHIAAATKFWAAQK